MKGFMSEWRNTIYFLASRKKNVYKAYFLYKGYRVTFFLQFVSIFRSTSLEEK